MIPLAAILLGIYPFPGPGRAVAGGGGATLISSTCQVLGSGGGMMTPIDTTGANFIVGFQAYFAGSVIIVNDNKSNGNATNLTQYSIAGDTTANIFYWTNPTTGANHIFNFGAAFSVACVFAFSNMATTSVLDSGTDSGAAPGTVSCATGSITLSTNDVIITGAAFGTAGSALSAPTGFTMEPTVGSINFLIGQHYGGGAAYRIQNGSTSSPTWTTPGDSACAIAAFKTM